MLSIASPFARLRQLLADHQPGLPAIDLSIGAPKHPLPQGMRTLSPTLEGLGHYPAISGMEETRQAVATWLGSRFGVALDAENEVMVANGSREALFYAGLYAVGRKRQTGCDMPYVAYPNPLYPVYGAVGPASYADNLPLPPTKNGYGLPDLDALSDKTLRKLACLYIGAPSNPQGTLAYSGYWQQALELGRAYGFYVFADECYSEIYYGAKPDGALTAAASTGSFEKLVSFNSLSKRSSVPGLRFGFVSGDADFIKGFSNWRNVCGPQMAEPTQRIGIALLEDESHVEDNRKLYRQKMALAQEALEGFEGFTHPEAGFCLWLNVSSLGKDEDIALSLWRHEGLKAIPGSYLAEEAHGHNPGAGFLRLALVSTVEETKTAMTRLQSGLERIKEKGA